MGYCDTIGIDLGTTRSSVAVWDGTQVHVIANESGDNTTPSWVTYCSSNSRRVGKYIHGTVYHAKRLIGRPFSQDLIEEKAALHWPFNVVDQDGNAAIGIKVEDEDKIVSPEEIAAAILSYLKRIAEEYIGRAVDKAVITVPAYFSDSQRQATRDAGLIAGLEVRRILNEPTAAALAFGVLEPEHPILKSVSALAKIETSTEASPAAEEAASNAENTNPDTADPEGSLEEAVAEHNMLVFDFGGGTLDVTIMKISGMSFKVRSTDGDMQVGGEDIDALLVQHFVKVFRAKTGVDLEGHADEAKRLKAYKKLTQACAQLKVELSRVMESDMCIDDMFDGIDFETSLTRKEFEEIAQPVFAKLQDPIDRALHKVHGGIERTDIDKILLVGGSSRIPRVQEMLQEMFPGTELCRRINPDEAIVIGAAIEASRTVDMIDVVPRPLCIATANHRDSSSEGVSYTECFANSRDDQTCITLRICEGEAEFFDDNVKLGVFEVTDIPPRPRGQVTIKVNMKVDSNGILSVAAKVDQTGQEMEVTEILIQKYFRKSKLRTRDMRRTLNHDKLRVLTGVSFVASG
ncbi:heat shock protein 70-like protein [Guillardia theta CCMP2712]|uniref:Heat shock protein 70-like protein n=1 Tax=Guillardia theta (strain CCMP2712) TaxID=905079 RepID=L1K2H7_GUITC|nr:heat shock protein 70-like protein [Guillardia theta CCMP2712]EKX54665.1 heat shock protein 70-like protein [Guillardia theta CCMP2712]|eukprot:XP_005841645.1 heat shock protein 70-like protein [Guillardia theta CCMP2712]